MEMVHYGRVATVLESPSELKTLFEEVEEYFDCGASLSRGAAVVDIGANIGAFAIAAAKRCEGDLRVFCFEPVPALFQALDRNLRRNHWLASGSHRAWNLALSTAEDAGVSGEFYYFKHLPRDSTMDLGGKRGEFEAFFAAKGALAGHAVSWLGPGAKLVERTVAWLPKGAVGRWMCDRVSGLERIQVPRDTLAGALHGEDMRRIDLLKVDVEGAEAKVLAGIDEATWACIQQAVIETNGAEELTRDLAALVVARGLDHMRITQPASTAGRGLQNVLIYAARPSAL